MKRAILPALGLALLLSLPAVSQDEENPMEKEIEALKVKVEEQDAAIKKLQTYVDNQKKQGARLNKSLAAAESEGFLLPAPNNDAKKSLLSGLQEFAGVAAGGAPKPSDSDEE